MIKNAATAVITVKDSAAGIEKSIHFDGQLLARIVESPEFSFEINTDLCHTVHSGIFYEFYFDEGLILTIHQKGKDGTFNLRGEDDENIPTEYRYIRED